MGIIALLYLGSLYRDVNTLVHMQTVTWILTGVFAVGGLVVFGVGKGGVIKNTKRADNYAIFLGVCALFALSAYLIISFIVYTVKVLKK